MVRVVGLDIGSGYTKCFDGTHRILFPSLYSYRQAALWEDRDGIVEAVGEQALTIAQHPNAVTLYPVVDGRPQHQAFIKLAEEALRRVKIYFYEDVCLVTGLPYESGRQDREHVNRSLREALSLSEIAVYPQAVGTLFDLDLKSATVINIGHDPSEIAVIENLNMLAGVSKPLASDYILTSLSNNIQAKYGFKPTTESLVALVSAKVDSITAFGKSEVRREEMNGLLKDAVTHLTDKISYDARYLLAHLPVNLECSKMIALSGGGSLIANVREIIEQQLNCRVLVPSDPIFSNVYGFYKMERKLHG